MSTYRSFKLMDDIPNPLYSFSTARNNFNGTYLASIVRRQSDNAEQQINYKGDDTLNTDQTDEFSNDGAIDLFYTSLYDNINQSDILEQPNAVNQPEFVKSGINNKPSFIGTANTTLSLNNSPDYQTSMTAFIVTEIDNSQVLNDFIFGSDTTTNQNNSFRFRMEGGNSMDFLYRTNGGVLFQSATIVADLRGKNLWRIVVNTEGTSKTEVYKTGVLQGSSSMGSDFKNELRNISIGRMNGLISELIIYDSLLNDRYINIIEDNIKDFYNIT